MKAIRLRKPGGLDQLVMDRSEASPPGPGEITVQIHASSLNYHDYVVVTGGLPTEEGRIPMSDGAGRVIAVGSGVKNLQAGDRVVSLFYPDWLGGRATRESTRLQPGDRMDGFAREQVTALASAFTKAPAGYTHAEAATLTCAGLTAWRALMVDGGLCAGDTVLVQGTGGVSIFALQFAKAAGATVIATSSSDEKLERLKALGADHLINYRTEPQWGTVARKLTGGRGVDIVVEVGGAANLPQSIKAAAMGSHIALIGVLNGFSGDVPTSQLMSLQICLKGLTVGSREQQEAMIRAIEANAIRPVIDSHFPLDDLAGAFRHQASNRHFGKICVDIPG